LTEGVGEQFNQLVEYLEFNHHLKVFQLVVTCVLSLGLCLLPVGW
jgi:hypothetical protein